MLDAIELWQKAAESPKGLEVKLPTKADATVLRHRMYSARVTLRREAKKAYMPGHPQHGRSLYEDMIIKVADDGTLTVLRTDAIEYQIKELI